MEASVGPGDGRQRLASKTKVATNDPARIFSLREWAVSLALRARYPQHSDQFSARELDHLRFVRWLYQTGRLTS
jgi:hypothetical protein